MKLKKTINNGVILLFVFLIAIFSDSCIDNKAVVKTTSDIDSVRKAINGAIGWAKNKNFKLLYSIIANDTGYIEVDPGRGMIRGFEEFKKNESFWGNPGFKALRYDIRDLKISVAKNGGVAWFYCILDDINEWKGQPVCWMNTRWTGVLEKREGRWVIIQMHFSFANE